MERTNDIHGWLNAGMQQCVAEMEAALNRWIAECPEGFLNSRGRTNMNGHLSTWTYTEHTELRAEDALVDFVKDYADGYIAACDDTYESETGYDPESFESRMAIQARKQRREDTNAMFMAALYTAE